MYSLKKRGKFEFKNEFNTSQFDEILFYHIELKKKGFFQFEIMHVLNYDKDEILIQRQLFYIIDRL